MCFIIVSTSWFKASSIIFCLLLYIQEDPGTFAKIPSILAIMPCSFNAEDRNLTGGRPSDTLLAFNLANSSIISTLSGVIPGNKGLLRRFNATAAPAPVANVKGTVIIISLPNLLITSS